MKIEIMPLNLTQTARLTKRALVIFGFLFTFLTVVYIGYQIYYYQYYLPHKPAPVEKPDEKFGPLPPPQFAPSSVSSSNYSYNLATVTGGLPTDIPKVLKVYFIPKLGTTLLASDKAKALANSFSFTQGPDVINQTQYQFKDNIDPSANMVIDLDTSNFKLTRQASSSAVLQTAFSDSAKISSDFKAYLDSKGLMRDDLKGGRTKVEFDQSGAANSQTATVSIWPADFNKLPVVTQNYNEGLIKAVINKSTDDLNRYQKLDYTYWSPDPQNASTYQLKTPDQALSDLKQGQGDVVVEPTNPQVALTSVYLAYFESDNYSLYLLPVYVFEGEGFVGYVNAISSDAVTKQ